MIKRRPLKIRREVLVSLAELSEIDAGRDPQTLSSGPSWCGKVCAN